MTASTARHVAIPDPPETISGNPIHGPEAARAAGYADALVAGIHVYGWACDAVLRHPDLAQDWLDGGWADVRLRRPTYPGDELTTTVAPAGEGAYALSTAKPDGTVVLEGSVGLGPAPFLAELSRPTRLDVQPAVPDDELEPMDLANAPIGEDFRPMEVDGSPRAASAWAWVRLGDGAPRWSERLHPSFLAGRMTPLFRHSYRYGPAIHVRSQIQHLGPALASGPLVVGARLHNAYERNGHHYHESDCLILDAAGNEIAHKRHTGIFKLASR